MFPPETPTKHPFNASNMDFYTPSPPRDMSGLPEPSSFATEQPSEADRTPMNPDATANLTAMKTPRPPGAWLQTPVSQHPSRGPSSRAQSTPPNGGETSTVDEMAAPVQTWPRTGSAPLQTPAPPGAWMQTPGASARKRSILKVRFDVDTETTDAESAAELPSQEPPSFPAIGAWRSDERSAEALGSVKRENDEGGLSRKAEGYTAEPSKPVRTHRKSWGMRIVDAFGRETKMEEEAPELPEDPVPEQKPIRKTKRSSFSNHKARNPVKIVDAMGREVEDVIEESDSPLPHNEALARVRETIAHMAEDLSEVDRSCEILAAEDNHVGALENASKAARSARSKITKSLRLVKTAESDLKSKYGPLRESMKKTRFILPGSDDPPQTTWSISWFWCLMLIQLVLCLLVYRRFAYDRAKRAFLMTYYDPFNAELYAYSPISSGQPTRSLSWSVFSIPEAIDRVGWVGAFKEFWGNVSSAVFDLRRHTTDILNTDYEGHTSSSSWPT
ncbi:uncharacterized protein LAESUDRAFT_657426 [Laetiporus sulphureus 93-53]|uniref:Uncharacterized protein n=1 Tax=Laetiporus sulphureus 93-53 TaxID=1314785 RepID=A0A165DEF6_9APHY|nr:uncharacterized protein LAESUDRAFT_657426 [Laetiporus sulphureus 93-53]KZT04703.1 hypothetical protein LAESUDRAFT_657426 [Laetiporus sulphureus 93-53]